MVPGFVGASILCFSIEPHTCGVYFLLGKEKYNPLWPSSSKKWSDFGGTVHASDRCVEDTAAREFVEETMGVVPFGDVIIPENQISNALCRGEYLCQLVIGTPPRQFAVFVKQIPWDMSVVQHFSETRKHAQCAHTHNPVCFEKCRIGYWSVPHLLHAVEYDGVLLQSNDRVEFCKKSFVSVLKLILAHLKFTHPSIF